MPCGFSGDTGTSVTTNRTQCPPSGSTTSTCPSRSRRTSRVGSRGRVTTYSYLTEATQASEGCLRQGPSFRSSVPLRSATDGGRQLGLSRLHSSTPCRRLATAFSSAGNGCGRPRGLAVRPVVGVDRRWVGDVDFSERHRPLLSVGTADIRHNIAQERQVNLMRSLKFASLLRGLGPVLRAPIASRTPEALTQRLLTHMPLTQYQLTRAKPREKPYIASRW